MKADLLDAQAAIDWAVTQAEAFNKRIESWASINLNTLIEDTPAPATEDRVVALLKEPLPRVFNVEFGAYLNTIRSSLDLLAVAVARRHNVADLAKVYFPVAQSENAFSRGNYKGSHFVNGLPDVERRKIEALKPYKGGNQELWDLHQLDIVRKHHRLIDVTARPIAISAGSTLGFFRPNPALSDWTLSVNQETVIGFFHKRRQDNEVKFFPVIACSEPGVAHRVPILAAIWRFAGVATQIISFFNN